MIGGDAGDKLRLMKKLLIPFDPPRVVKRSVFSERVVNGDVNRTPVDRVAARVTSQAPEICHERALPIFPVKPKPTTERKNMPEIPAKVLDSHFHGDQILKGSKAFNDICEEVATRVLAEMRKDPPKLLALADSFAAASKVLDEQLQHVNQAKDDFAAKIKVFLDDIRSTRMAATTETSSMLQPLKEIRQFFLGPDYANEINRLKEFVELCERLNALKESGFLDKVADTMIRLG